MKLAMCYGGLYQFTNKAWKEYVKQGSTGAVDADAFGKLIHSNVPNVTDWTNSEFQDAFDDELER